MTTALGWFFVAMIIWGCCLAMSVIERRVNSPANGAPKTANRWQWSANWFGMGDDSDYDDGTGTQENTALKEEIAELRGRVETLEAIVTDKRFQWEQELNRGNKAN